MTDPWAPSKPSKNRIEALKRQDAKSTKTGFNPQEGRLTIWMRDDIELIVASVFLGWIVFYLGVLAVDVFSRKP